MPQQSVENLLQELRTRDPHDGWEAFLEEYAGLIFQVSRYVEKDLDRASDCFQFVCEKLSEDGFRRLLRFKPDGPASFSTWLRAVVRNLCLDRRRKEFGRPRRFRSISRLSLFDQEVFSSVYERRVSVEEALQLLQTNFPDVTSRRVAESRERIEQVLTTKQRWLLSIRSITRRRAAGTTFEEADPAPLRVPDPRPNPEAQALLAERRAGLDRALDRLSKRERLLVRLRFEQELTLDQIAKVLDLGNAQRADREIKEILVRLRLELR